MTWTALRRRRNALVAFLLLALALDVWMLVNGHSSAAELQRTGLCTTLSCEEPAGAFAPARQAVVIDLLLLVFPLALGLVLGVGLVAAETERGTHRLAWTQGVTRTRWYLTSLAVAGGGALVVVAAELPVAHWWAGVAWVDLPTAFTLGGSRIQPDVYPVSGVVPLAYTLAAVSLGGAAGALLRRVPWASAVTVIGYAVLAVVMVVTVRPSLAPAGFTVSDTTSSAQYVDWPDPPPWNTSYVYRSVPGVERPAGAPSPDRVAVACTLLGIHPQGVVHCLDRNGVQGGFVVQPPTHYWRLQWAESVLYAALAVALAGLGLVAVRRSQD